MQLSPRLKAVADSVTRGNRVADVGCDHAYISIYLIEHNIAPNVLAMDVNKGPLERAGENINRFGYHSRIETRLSDGLQKAKPGEIDTILLAGMGGALMVRILEEGLETVKECNELILQPQSELFLVRRYLHKIGFRIEMEHMLIDDGKYYVIMKGMKEPLGENYNQEVFYQYGKLLLEQKEPILKEYLLREKRIREEVMVELGRKLTEKAKERMEEVLQEIAYIEEALSYYKIRVKSQI
jgi:tRNA (adenine22-N1)-methyltransferase